MRRRLVSICIDLGFEKKVELRNKQTTTTTTTKIKTRTIRKVNY